MFWFWSSKAQRTIDSRVKKKDVCRTSAPLEEMEGVPDGELWGEGVGVTSALTKTMQAWKNTRA